MLIKLSSSIMQEQPAEFYRDASCYNLAWLVLLMELPKPVYFAVHHAVNTMPNRIAKFTEFIQTKTPFVEKFEYREDEYSLHVRNRFSFRPEDCAGVRYCINVGDKSRNGEEGFKNAISVSGGGNLQTIFWFIQWGEYDFRYIVEGNLNPLTEFQFFHIFGQILHVVQQNSKTYQTPFQWFLEELSKT